MSSSLFVLFNVMGVVFTVVNGLCMGGQMCYYDKNIVANRSMAILLIVEHCLCILLSVFLAKQAHVIDAQLNSDVGVKLKYPLGRLRKTISRISNKLTSDPKVVSSDPNGSVVSLRRENTETPDLHHVQTDHEGKVMSTIEISAMRRKRFKHKRSKSNPIQMDRNVLKPQSMAEEVFSIYSDSEMKDSLEVRRKKPKVFRFRNRVSVINTKNKPRTKDSAGSSDDDTQEVEIVQTTTLSLQSSGLVVVAPYSQETDDQNLTAMSQKRQMEGQSESEITETDSSPPSYDSVIIGPGPDIPVED